MKKQNQRIVLEVLVGLVPVTFLLLPLLAAGAVGSPFAIFATLVDPQWPAAIRLQMILPLVWVDVWVVAAVVGVFAAWVLVLGSGTKFLDRRPIRIGLAGFLLLGIIAELRCFTFCSQVRSPMISQPGRGGSDSCFRLRSLASCDFLLCFVHLWGAPPPNKRFERAGGERVATCGRRWPPAAQPQGVSQS